MKAKQTMREFFARADIKVLQGVQKQNPYGSPDHKLAFEMIKRKAAKVGAAQFIGDY